MSGPRDGLIDRVRLGLVDSAGFAGLVTDDVALSQLSEQVLAELVGTGPLEPLLGLPGVTDVLVNGPAEVWFDRGAGLERAAVGFADEAAVRRLAQRLAATAGRRLDDASPFVDVALTDGTRLHAILPPLVAATTISLRVLGRRRFSLADLVPPHVAQLLEAVIAARLAFLISGGTGSGKTTLLGTLLDTLPPTERALVIEDVRELVTAHPHLVRLTTRTANVEAAGSVGLRDLVRQALRMRPDRLFVGEFRGAETVDLLIALNTGHEGGAATLHANSAADVPARLVALGLLGGVQPDALVALAAGAFAVSIHLRRAPRAVAEVAVLSAGELRVTSAWTPAGKGPAAPVLARLLSERGVAVPAALR